MFDAAGLFRADLRTGEDTELHGRLGVEIEWRRRCATRTATRQPSARWSPTASRAAAASWRSAHLHPGSPLRAASPSPPAQHRPLRVLVVAGRLAGGTPAPGPGVAAAAGRDRLLLRRSPHRVTGAPVHVAGADSTPCAPRCASRDSAWPSLVPESGPTRGRARGGRRVRRPAGDGDPGLRQQATVAPPRRRPRRPIDRSGGTGDQPPHMDFVNASLPPDYVFLYCARPDPLGGGASLVAPTRVVEDLGEDTATSSAARLRRRSGRRPAEHRRGRQPVPRARRRRAFPAAVHRQAAAGRPRTEALAAVQALADRVAEATVRVHVRPGEMLVLDQRRVLHGRGSLGGDQRDVAPERRRLLLHGFGRDETASASGPAPGTGLVGGVVVVPALETQDGGPGSERPPPAARGVRAWR